MRLQWWKYYIAKLSYFKSNPIHERIVYIVHDKKGEEIINVFNGLNCEEIRIVDLNYFEIINEINIKI